MIPPGSVVRCAAGLRPPVRLYGYASRARQSTRRRSGEPHRSRSEMPWKNARKEKEKEAAGRARSGEFLRLARQQQQERAARVRAGRKGRQCRAIRCAYRRFRCGLLMNPSSLSPSGPVNNATF
ncbi:hypothetical protein Sxan_31540 [Streptomyces xanthophaeus]|uniref:Uncharacterized protein n=1 Tax=Streptomyces xanthophaeus TaxID=67385 RepID=A0A919LCG6_9ACTN|nr:hypothetical protein Sxan_31540 [Streptomyces xanthophaeus]